MPQGLKRRVGFHETDQMRYLYHGNYASYYHASRTELLRSVGMHDSALEKKGVMLLVVKLSSSFLSPAYYDDELEVFTELVEVSACKLHFKHQIFHKETKLNEGETILAYVDAENRKPVKIPDKNRVRLEELVSEIG